jgi:hypothetical protein
MNPKEKAKELVSKFYFDLPQWVNTNDAKLCANIAVDELIIHSRNTAMAYDLSFDESENYWAKVKNEIKLL